MKKMEHPGVGRFTLIELMIVITIIAILAAILLPTLARAKKKTKYVLCINNQRQYSTALNLFAKDNEGYFPSGVNNAGHHTPGQVGDKFKNGMEDYIVDWDLARCPDYEFWCIATGGRKGWGYFTGYLNFSGMNSNLFNSWDSPQKLGDDSDLLLLACYNTQPVRRYATRYTHTSNGWLFDRNPDLWPLDADLEGTNITRLDGSYFWRDVSDMKHYSAHNGLRRIKYWW